MSKKHNYGCLPFLIWCAVGVVIIAGLVTWSQSSPTSLERAVGWIVRYAWLFAAGIFVYAVAAIVAFYKLSQLYQAITAPLPREYLARCYPALVEWVEAHPGRYQLRELDGQDHKDPIYVIVSVYANKVHFSNVSPLRALAFVSAENEARYRRFSDQNSAAPFSIPIGFLSLELIFYKREGALEYTTSVTTETGDCPPHIAVPEGFELRLLLVSSRAPCSKLALSVVDTDGSENTALTSELYQAIRAAAHPTGTNQMESY